MGHSPSSFYILPAIVDLIELELQLWEQQGYGRGQVERVSARFEPVELPLDIGEEPFCGYCFGSAQVTIPHTIPCYKKSQELSVSTNTLLEVDAINPVSTCLIKNAHIMAGCALLQVGGRA
jgi:hypothetical protein